MILFTASYSHHTFKLSIDKLVQGQLLITIVSLSVSYGHFELPFIGQDPVVSSLGKKIPSQIILRESS